VLVFIQFKNNSPSIFPISHRFSTKRVAEVVEVDGMHSMKNGDDENGDDENGLPRKLLWS